MNTGRAGNESIIDHDNEIQRCLTALCDEKANVRRCAAELLGRIQDEKALEPLLRTLEDEDSWVRKGAVEALGNLGNEKAIPYLERLKGDSSRICYGSGTVGEAALEAIETIRR